MKRPPSKAQIRSELENQIEQFLQDGGTVQNVPKGQSGYADNRNIFGQLGENPPRQERTPLDDVVKNLEARKKGSSSLKPKRPRRKLITDDFGEPLRWVWIED